MIYYVLVLLVPLGVVAQISLSDDTPIITVDAVAPVNSQYHTQDLSGQYSYGYSNGDSSKEESRSSDGITRGSYSYVDANGFLQSVSYEADAEHGFRVAATNLPITTSQSISSPNNGATLLKEILSATENINELPIKEIFPGESKQANETKGKYTPQKGTENKVEQIISESYKNEDIPSLNSLSNFPARALSPKTNTEKSSTENNNLLVNNDPLSFLHPLVKINPTYTPIPVAYSPSIHNKLSNGVLLVNQLPNYYNDIWNRVNYAPLLRRENVYQFPSPYMIYNGVTPLFRQSSFVPSRLSNVQYHLQDDRGQYLYRYNNQLGTKEENREVNDVTRGYYSHPDTYGRLQSVSYTADDIHGFNLVQTSLPQWPFIGPFNK